AVRARRVAELAAEQTTTAVAGAGAAEQPTLAAAAVAAAAVVQPAGVRRQRQGQGHGRGEGEELDSHHAENSWEVTRREGSGGTANPAPFRRPRPAEFRDRSELAPGPRRRAGPNAHNLTDPETKNAHGRAAVGVSLEGRAWGEKKKLPPPSPLRGRRGRPDRV